MISRHVLSTPIYGAPKIAGCPAQAQHLHLQPYDVKPCGPEAQRHPTRPGRRPPEAKASQGKDGRTPKLGAAQAL